MIPMLAALMAGYGLGTFVKSARIAYPLCVPVSAIVYLLKEMFFTSFSREGMQYPGMAMFVTVGVLQAPLLMLGVFLARRKARRSGYDS